MSEAFQLAHAFTARWEGGLSDHPSDPGGITNHGVSLRWVQDLARQARDECRRLLRSCDGCRERATPQCGWYSLDLDTDGDVDADDIRACTKAQAAALFRTHFWDKLSCKALPLPLAVTLYDGAVNMGPARAVRQLQQAMNTTGEAQLDHYSPIAGDGIMGPRTRELAEALAGAHLDFYAELGTFGTAFAFELADPRWGFRFVPLCAGEYALDCNARRRVDTVFRRASMSLRQIAEAFGTASLPDSLREAGGRNPEERHTVIQAVFPRSGRAPGHMDALRMPVASVHWLEGRDGGEHPLRESGFTAFPGFGPRWETAGGDVYGRSPAMDALPDCRMLQQMGITTLKAIHKAVDPPMSVSAGLKAVGLDLTPGGINYVDSLPGQSPQAATPLLQVRPDLATARKAMEAVQNQIRAGLYNDLFKLILEGRAQVTASEIAAREEEKLVLIGPVLERLHDELFIPLIDRTFELMRGLDMLPPCPPELAGRRLKVEFVSLLAQAQKLVGVSAADQYLALTLRASTAWPEALDSLNVDNLLDNYAESLGLPVSLTRPPEERQRLRDARARAAQGETLGKQLGEAADLLKTLAQSPLAQARTDGGDGSVLDGLFNLLRRVTAAAPATGGTPMPPAPTEELR